MSEQPSKQTRRGAWYRHITAWQASGLSQAAYCREQQIKLPNFYYWSGRYRHEQRRLETDNITAPLTAKPNFIPVSIQPSINEISVSCHDVSLRFTNPLSPEDLVPWIKALRAGVC